MKEFQELSEDELCPCGSGKTYGECCKKKRFRYGMSDGDIIRQIKITDEAVDALEYLESMFQEYYGREIKQDEYVFAFMPVYNDRFLVENVYAIAECYKSVGVHEADIINTMRDIFGLSE